MSDTTARRAFTIVELLVAVPLAALLFCAVAEALVLLVSVGTRVNDEAAAYARADRAWSVLREPLALCGYGMPKNPADYVRAFPLAGATNNTFYSWPGPLSVAPSIVNAKERVRGSCRIVHATPSNVMTASESVTSADCFIVELTGRPPLLESSSYNPIWPKNWAVFGAVQPPSGPFWLVAHDGPRRVTLRRNLPTPGGAEILTIPRNDELFYLQATEAEVRPYGQNDWALYTNRHDGSGRQPRVVGVVDARFELPPTGRTMKMRLLIRGDRRHSEQITPDTPPGWPEEYAADIPDEAGHYRLYVFEMTFGLSNF